MPALHTKNRASILGTLPSTRLLAVVLGILAVFFVVNLATCDRSPTVWKDEVFFSDPAYHLAAGDGFTSTSSPAEQDFGAFWAMNSPLHPFLLAGWIHLFGFTVFSVRAFNVVIITLAFAVLAWAAARTEIFRAPGPLLLVLALGTCGMGVTFGYRSARPECLGILLGTLIWLAWTLRSVGLRLGLLVLIGFLVPFTGVHLILALGIYGVALVFAATDRLRVLLNLAGVGLGVALGLGALVAIYAHFGVLDRWLYCLHKHSAAQKGADVVLAKLGSSYKQDPSFIAVALAGAIGLRALRGQVDRRVRIIFCAALLVPLVLTLAGNYPPYYSWLAYLPLCVTAAVVVSEAWPRFSWPVRGVVAVLVVLALAIGLPARTALALSEWNERSYEPVDRFLKNNLRKDDIGYCDYQAFYGSEYATRFYYPNAPDMGDWVKGITVVVMPDYVTKDEIVKKVGGNWQKVADLPASPDSIWRSYLPRDAAFLYQLDVWRRSPAKH